MLCSISTGKSGSNWLDRLRSSKGFPAANDLDLEQFLSLHGKSSDTKFTDSTMNRIDPKSNTNSTQSSGRLVLDRNQTTEIPRENGEKEWFGAMSNVLAELFYMGDSNDFSRIHGKKSSRKQSNPRICVVSRSPSVEDMRADDVRRNEGVLATLPSNDDNSRAEMKETNDQMKMTEQEHGNVGLMDGTEEEKSHADLSALSGTEVTVIDTSCPSWKFEKMLFRRKNVWKIRDKKCTAMDIDIRKRKVSPLNENVGGEKKPKLYFGQCSSSKNGNREEGIVPSNGGHDRSDKMKEACRETPNIRSQVLKKKRFPRKLKKGGSSVILIKNIPSIMKNGASIPKSSLKSTQRQYKA